MMTARRAAALGADMRHAGLFSTAGDVAVYAQNLLDRLPAGQAISRYLQLTTRKDDHARPAGYRLHALRAAGTYT